ncbi:hypothetical protein JCM6882_003782 [Rhodosporidiobolus microsporus]
MSLDHIKEELLVLQASLLDGELSWDEEDERLAWEAVLQDERPPQVDLPLPSLSLTLSPKVDLAVKYRRDAPPTFSIHSLVLGREDQASLAREVGKQAREVQDEPLPVFTLYTALQEWITANPLSSSRQASAEPAPPPQRPKAGPFQLKTTLLWSHHLLATSKRKDIVAWSTELELWGLSKPGYPGVIIVEGVKEGVDEFVHRIKQLQWKALQVRCEQDGAIVAPPSSISPADASTWVVRNGSLLGPAISSDPKEKICVKEVEGLNEVGEIMRKAGMYDVFLTALKLK